MSESKCGTLVSEVKGVGEGADADKDAGDGVDMAVGDGADEGAEDNADDIDKVAALTCERVLQMQTQLGMKAHTEGSTTRMLIRLCTVSRPGPSNLSTCKIC